MGSKSIFKFKPSIFITLLVPFLLIPSLLFSEPTGIPVTVVYVISADTIKVLYQGTEQKVKLLGIDTPEPKKNWRAERDAERWGRDLDTIIAMGKKSTEFTRKHVKKRDKIYLEFHGRMKDKYGKLLAYVWLKDGRMLNEVIIANGYGMVYKLSANMKYKNRFIKAQRMAKSKGRGLW